MRQLLSGLGAALLVGGLSVTAMPAQAAPASVSGTVVLDCNMPSFPSAPPFEYAAQVKLSGSRAGEGGPVSLALTTSALPGVVPKFISMNGAEFSASFSASANGSAVKLNNAGKTDVNPSKNGTQEPVKLPGTFKGDVNAAAADVTVTFQKFDFDVAGVGGTCTSRTAEGLTLTPSVSSAPVETTKPTPTPTASPSPTATATSTPTASPTKKPTKEPSEKPTEKAGEDGKPASGQVAFDCVLAPFDSAFRYEGKITVSGARAKEGDTDVTLAATMPQIPGIAPVPIENGRMVATVKGKVDGKAVTFSSETTVNAAAKAKVSVKRATAEVKTSAEKAKVELEAFGFKFDPISGLEISAECDIAKGGSLGSMAIAVGELDDEDEDDTPNGSGGGTGGTTGGTEASLPRTGGGDAMPVIALWAAALGVVGAGLLVWIPRRRAASQQS